MKIILAATLIIAIQATVARADDKDSPPIPISQPEPEWPPELSKSYVINPTKVTLVVDERGVPFSLSGTAVADNVVTALAQWRFRPGKRDGKSVPFAITLVVPVREALDDSSERWLRRRSYYISKAVEEAYKTGTGLDIGGAEQLEKNLATDLNNIDIRGRLMLYSIESASTDAKDAADRRARHIEFLVQNLPDEVILATPLTLINKTGGPLADPEAYARVRELWLAQVAAKPDDAAVLEHATYFLRVSDAEKAEQLLLAAIRNVPETPVWIGDLYGLSLLGVNALDLKTGLAVSTSSASSPFAQKARSNLTTTNDPKIIIAALNAVVEHGRALAQLGALPEGYAAVCNELLGRAKSFHPGTTLTCDPSAIAPKQPQAITRIRVGGNVQQSALIKKVTPLYPPDAKVKGIQGVVRFLTIIDTDGSIKHLSFVSGPFALYRSAHDAVQQWKYKPTQLNGKPVEVITTIEVNYTLSR